VAVDFTFFSPGHNALLQALSLRSGVGVSQLGVAAVLLAAALGYCAYTDAFAGRIIRNTVVGVIAFAATVSAPLIFAHALTHFLYAAAMIGIIFIIYLSRAIKEGDLKLYAALAIVFAQGIIVLLLASFAIIIIYGLPLFFRSRALARRENRSHGFTQVVAAPGIALAYPLTLLLAGVSAGNCLLLVIVEVLAVTAAIFFADLQRRADAQELAKHEPALGEAVETAE
jgi:hypothetical protein